VGAKAKGGGGGVAGLVAGVDPVPRCKKKKKKLPCSNFYVVTDNPSIEQGSTGIWRWPFFP